jgi:hypothetical protein
MMRELPKFEGWTIDERLRQFRKVTFGKGGPSIEFVEFDSPKGHRMIKKLNESRLKS